MAKDRKVYGRINCGICLTPSGVIITQDKNGDPFGHCDANCNCQSRIGGDDGRVVAFYAAHPHVEKTPKWEEKLRPTAPPQQAAAPVPVAASKEAVTEKGEVKSVKKVSPWAGLLPADWEV